MDTRLINIQFENGNVKRIPRNRASDLVDAGKAIYISNTIYKAAIAGVTVNRGMSEVQIKNAICKRKTSHKHEAVQTGRQPRRRRNKKGKKKKEG